MLPVLLRAPRRIFSALGQLNQRRNASSTKVVPYKQDLPPAGGYAPFDWERIHQQPFPSANKQFVAMLIFMFGGFYIFDIGRQMVWTWDLEKLDAKVALQPIILAERDRLFLRRCRRNYEAETELMKDVPGWEVGKWYDTPIYKTLPANLWIEPESFEFWEHCDHFEYDKWFHWWWE